MLLAAGLNTTFRTTFAHQLIIHLHNFIFLNIITIYYNCTLLFSLIMHCVNLMKKQGRLVSNTVLLSIKLFCAHWQTWRRPYWVFEIPRTLEKIPNFTCNVGLHWRQHWCFFYEMHALRPMWGQHTTMHYSMSSQLRTKMHDPVQDKGS
jgi:hypothetical protein